MKKTNTILLLFILTFVNSTLHSQDSKKKILNPVSDVSGIQVIDIDFKPNYVSANYPPVVGKIAVYTFQPMPVFTVYDLQSNAVPSQIWQDPMVPDNVHATFLYSIVPGFATRNSAYLFSTDAGATWTNLGDVPDSVRSGFPSITGFPDVAGGSPAIITNHNASNGTTLRVKINYDAGPGFNVFTEIDPGPLQGEDGIWGKVLGLSNSKIVFCASVNGSLNTATNVATSLAPPGSFSGYAPFSGNSAETYSLALAPNGKVGHAFTGAPDGTNDYDAFYRFSDDNGLSWGPSTRIWDWNGNTDSLGVLRGISVAFGNNNEPYVAFEVSKISASGFLENGPSTIRVWCPVINNGIPVIIAGPLNVPFYPNTSNDGFLSVCRPSIGRSSVSSQLFVAFSATTGEYGKDSSAYYAAWMAYSHNYGNTWNSPERMTPVNPLRDWRFVSVSPTNLVSHSGITETIVQMIIQSDSLPGIHVTGAPISVGQAIGIHGIFPGFISVNSNSNMMPEEFSLHQNFPNPFNPTTTIKFDIARKNHVTLKVFDSKGREVSVLIDNRILTPGTKEVFFDGNNLSTGIYFYTLFAGDYKETRKMILIK